MPRPLLSPPAPLTIAFRAVLCRALAGRQLRRDLPALDAEHLHVKGHGRCRHVGARLPRLLLPAVPAHPDEQAGVAARVPLQTLDGRLLNVVEDVAVLAVKLGEVRAPLGRGDASSPAGSAPTSQP